MAAMWRPHPVEVYADWIETIIQEASDELNDWEINFIDDMRLRTDNGIQLTQGQAEKLEQIYADKT